MKHYAALQPVSLLLNKYLDLVGRERFTHTRSGSRHGCIWPRCPDVLCYVWKYIRSYLDGTTPGEELGIWERNKTSVDFNHHSHNEDPCDKGGATGNLYSREETFQLSHQCSSALL